MNLCFKESKRASQISQLLEHGQYVDGRSTKLWEHFYNLRLEGLKYKCPLAATLALSHFIVSGVIVEAQYSSAARYYLGVLPNTDPVKVCIQELLDRKSIEKKYSAQDHKLCHYITKAMELPASEQADFKEALLHKNYPEPNTVMLYELAAPSMFTKLYELAEDYGLIKGAIKVTIAVMALYSIHLLLKCCPDAPVANTNNDNDNNYDLDDGYFSGGDTGGYGSDGYGGYDSD
jgi:hypothetical protein